MACHESALDAIYEDPFSGSDVEEGEIEDGEYPGFQPMDVDKREPKVLSEGEISAEDDDPSPGETVDGANAPCEVFKFKSDDGQLANENEESGPMGPAARRSGRRRSKKRRAGKRKTVDIPRFVRETCDHLQEKKISLMWALVKKLGVDAVRGLVNEVDVIEKCGGQMTNDKKRRRTRGGVLWNILRGRVQPQVYKEIMSQGQEVLKKKTKEANETLKRQRMDIDEPANRKRRRVVKKDADTPMAGTDGKEVTWPTSCHNVPKDLSTLTDGPVRDDSGLPVNLIQQAWVEGLKKKDDIDGGGTPTARVLTTGPEMSGCPADSIIPIDKAVNVVDRLRVPVEYSDLETGDKESSREPLENLSSQVQEPGDKESSGEPLEDLSFQVQEPLV